MHTLTTIYNLFEFLIHLTFDFDCEDANNVRKWIFVLPSTTTANWEWNMPILNECKSRPIPTYNEKLCWVSWISVVNEIELLLTYSNESVSGQLQFPDTAVPDAS